jgi:plasmid replication initiation protein
MHRKSKSNAQNFSFLCLTELDTTGYGLWSRFVSMPLTERYFMSKNEKYPVAVQANSLVSARYRLTLGEQRMVLMMICKIGYEDELFQGYEITIKELADTLQLNEDCAYREANVITDKLLKRILRIKRADGSLLKCNWIAEAIHQPGRVTLTPAPSLRPYLLELRERFTIVPLAQIKGLRSQYSVRIYMLLRQHLGLGSFEVTVDDFKAMLDIGEQYQRFNALRSWVLEAARKELTEKSDLSFKLETLRTGRTITRLKFIIVKNKPEISKKTKAENIGKSLEKIADAAVNSPPVNRWLFPEYWDEFLQYIEKKDPSLLPIIASDGPECMLVKVPYNRWSREFK